MMSYSKAGVGSVGSLAVTSAVVTIIPLKATAYMTVKNCMAVRSPSVRSSLCKESIAVNAKLHRMNMAASQEKTWVGFGGH